MAQIVSAAAFVAAAIPLLVLCIELFYAPIFVSVPIAAAAVIAAA